KSKKHTYKPKSDDSIQEKLYLLHMDQCGPMRIKSINGKKYILAIVDDYSRFTCVKFLRSKDETPKIVIKLLKKIQVCLNATVRNIRTDNGIEFVNKTLQAYYDDVGVSYQTSIVHTPQQSGIVERRNRTLVEATSTMLIFSTALFSRLVQNPLSTTPYVPPTKNDWGLLFQQMFNEYFNPPPNVVSLVRAVTAPRPVDTTGTPLSTSNEHDAPAASTSSTTQETQSLVLSKGFEEVLGQAPLEDDIFLDILTSEPS
ncbi:retrovirus-related pol polyprotein from transposon TNT 1-94, partial [Tanacetum coccineum]